ncbi:unnamed protein product [Haemonchus placei]|uniref:Uncharacterized protein n=1 Tax=Haemonchus placei TaxID=6290 RepID=A0A0N4VUG7_HAEPC|nr:unnamed protein product [Haemonchus placei]
MMPHRRDPLVSEASLHLFHPHICSLLLPVLCRSLCSLKRKNTDSISSS